MKPDVLLINLPYVVKNIDANRPKLRSFLAFPLGLLSVATYCKDLANIRIVDCDTELNHKETIIREMQMFRPSIVGFSMMMDCSYAHLFELLWLVKSIDPKVTTILGGAAASYSYQEILQEQTLLDAVCYSEGEVPFRNLLLHLGTWPDSFVTRWDVEKDVHISYIENLDDVIDIDYSFVNPSAYGMEQAFSPFVDHDKKHKQFFIVTSRGCPFHCAFCSNGKIHGKKMRFVSVDRIINHVRYLVDDLGMDVLTIYDDQLLIDMPRAKLLFRLLADFKLRIEMPNGLSPAFIDAEMAHLMRRAGVDTTYLAIEHGSDWVLKNIIHKPLKLFQVKPVVEWLRAEGFFIHGFFVIGMPGEQQSDRDKTVEFIKEIGLDWAGLNAATPVRGSELYDQCISKGWIKKQRIDEIQDKKYIINAPEIGLTPEIIEAEINRMNLDVNFHNNYRMGIGDYAVAVRCFQEVIRRYEGHEVAKYYLSICQERMKYASNKTV
jgi:anaerobic magnesium-protoporphyrin IX monomethyl ester cyclase